MTAIYFDPDHTDDERRLNIYSGDIYVYSPTPASVEFCEFARELLQQHFADLEPELAQYKLDVDAYAEILGALKPTFIHHPRSKQLLQRLMSDRSCNPDSTYFEVPKLRSSTSDDYLTSGIAYAWHPHRDTWYSASPCQINWWMPVYDIRPDNCMSFHTRYWHTPVENTSAGYNYYEWNLKYRGPAVAKMTSGDRRPLPRPVGDVEMQPDLRVVCPVGGTILFSAAHLHSSVPNTSGKTRFSIDFRTVNIDDALGGVGAPNLDSASTGTVLGDFLKCRDFTKLPAETLAHFLDGTEDRGLIAYGETDRA